MAAAEPRRLIVVHGEHKHSELNTVFLAHPKYGTVCQYLESGGAILEVTAGVSPPLPTMALIPPPVGPEGSKRDG